MKDKNSRFIKRKLNESYHWINTQITDHKFRIKRLEDKLSSIITIEETKEPEPIPEPEKKGRFEYNGRFIIDTEHFWTIADCSEYNGGSSHVFIKELIALANRPEQKR